MSKSMFLDARFNTQCWLWTEVGGREKEIVDGGEDWRWFDGRYGGFHSEGMAWGGMERVDLIVAIAMVLAMEGKGDLVKR